MNFFAYNLWGFMRGLRRLGFSLTDEDLQRAVEGLQLTGAVLNSRQVLQVLQVLWCHNRQERLIFPAAFHQWLLLLGSGEGAVVAQETYLAQVVRRHREESPSTGSFWLGPPRPNDAVSTTVELVQGASREESLAARRLERLSNEELAALMAWSRPRPPLVQRGYIRRSSDRGDRWEPGETMRRGREGSEWLRLYFSAPRMELRHITILLDVSGSMTAYHRPLLQYLHTMMRQHPKLSVYTFSTRLTSITRALRYFHVDRSLAEISALTPDRGGGTRLGESLETLWRRERGRAVGSRSTLVIVTDGLESSFDDRIEQWVIQWRRYLAGRLYWWNPYAPNLDELTVTSARVLARHARYEPVATFDQLELAWKRLGDDPIGKRTGQLS